MTIQALINKIFRANQTQNNTVSWSGSNGLKSIQEDIVGTIRERTFFTVPTTAALANQGFNNAILCYVQDHAFFRWQASGTPNGTTIFPANDGGVWVQETIGDTDGTVTSVSALTINSTGTDLSSTVANPTTTPVITLSVPTASALNRGVLSSADWTAFNSKQNAITLTTTGTSGAATLVGATLNIPQYQSVLTNPVTGTGASGQVAFWNGTTTQTGSNNLFWDNVNSRLGIGTTTPTTKLDVLGGFRLYTGGAAPSSHYFEGISTSGTNTYLNLVRNGGANGTYAYYLNNGVASLSVDNGSGETRLWSGIGGYYLTFFSNGLERMRIPTTGNVLIGTTTDAGYKLDVNGTARINSTLSLTNSTYAGTFSFYLSAANVFQASSSNIGVWLQVGGGNRVYIIGQEFNSTSRGNIFGNTVGGEAISATTIIAQSSGTAATTGLSLRYTINNTGTYVGISRGIYYNPTITSLTGTTHRAIETVVGDVIFGSTSGAVGVGANTTINASAILDITSTTKGFLPPRMTNAQRTAIATPSVGLIVYCTDAVEGLYIYKSTGWTFII